MRRAERERCGGVVWSPPLVASAVLAGVQLSVFTDSEDGSSGDAVGYRGLRLGGAGNTQHETF